ncbi:nuclear transport factor 2 family protein [Luteolibacter arcticus]|uniref:Nuclear transport factor 2 family protein n=1 Tax=Luteolibacter arcticus TaxID=1581411 RepID=A0ABT3GKD6_9BACT|nr:nuclear transport factor 2 family protein [Luteolibacter arcticus]MCW1923931.1 nuclear transport factor 2 family protein [Luteolibacter arcticus]
MSKNIKAVPTKEYTEVVATANKYVDGLRGGSPADVADAFHKDAVMYGFTNGELLGGPIQNLYDFVEQNGKAPKIETRVDVLAITPTIAVVRIDMENDAIGADYNDYLTLIKIDGTWMVIAKVYHQFENQA